ncbi:exosome complex component CSL4-like isoform X2 [Homarus americanus]|uniref:Exosome complex component CSL4-like n=2 Tax=Homarus americanus TaxID=6706 RepID=A0A8J5T242_HOMAM|nr:exosome complex component CSL4-like isoform X2 [Homarus americanus]XP_042216538.1 exosome complex component CSL4-like isoform X2 [Homarus americanus]XP_042216539.1 exosome complex component CSL4-like isoform X2 [Homarus americanus]KAG7171915.1 Exosome complex component CSL4-like [Homarus americanus]
MKSGNGHILCSPGQRICGASSCLIAGEGTYTFNKYIYASLAGHVTVIPRGEVQVVKVTLGREGTVMPEAGSVVTCRVLSVNPNLTTVSIICVGPNKLHSPVSGTVRKQNVRDHQVDTVEMYNCFRPDDIILAVVLSLGDLRNYELSTAGTELGVVTAYCEEGHPLVPASWTTMKCKCRTERRKVAKVMPPKSSHT